MRWIVFSAHYVWDESEKNWWQLFFKCFREFTNVATSSWTFFFFLFVFFFPLRSYKWLIKSPYLFYVCLYFLCLLESVFVTCLFLEICPLYLGYLTCWCITIQSIQLQFCFCNDHIYVLTFISDFSYLKFIFPK